MKDINEGFESPLEIKVSFNKLLLQYSELLKHTDKHIVNKSRRILEIAENYPELRDGFSDVSILEIRKKEISVILQDAFSAILTKNEIKTASVPFHNLIFNASDRFRNILNTAGTNFELNLRYMPSDEKYIIACAIILNICYGYNINFKRPFYYEIPDVNGILRYYKILYNADFTEIIPKKHAPHITQQDFELLLDNFENIELWKEKFPPSSYLFKGFVISNIFDVTDDQSISNIKSSLIGRNKRRSEGGMDSFHKIFQSLLGLNDIQVGFSIYNQHEDLFERAYRSGLDSFLLYKNQASKCADILCDWSQKRLLEEKRYFSISDVQILLDKSTAPHLKSLEDQGFRSAIFAPLANNDGLMGILEIVSKEPLVLNSISANKLEDVMPFIISAVERIKKDRKNLIEAIIQKECTSIHPSVHWRFEKEAKNFIKDELNGQKPVFNKIGFDNVYPLYGQIDVKGSSEARNQATKEDLKVQLNLAKLVLEKAFQQESLPIYEQHVFQINNYLDQLDQHFQVDTEQQVTRFLKGDINDIFKHFTKINIFVDDLKTYHSNIDKKLHVLYYHRKQYDSTITSINKELASLLDKKQEEAQLMYPHYFERFKTDGVEHNMYIGEAITKKNSFNPIYLYNLRLWQLQVMCEMENAYYQMQSSFPISLDVASMILVFNQPLSISFRMDEKQFDVDGTYNARYEIVKKRVDKAYIKGTDERVTQKGKISIVYSQKQDEIEYLRYVKFLQSKNYLDNDIEIVELQDLQAVTGLKAIRVSVLYHAIKNDKAFYTYTDLMKEIKV